MRSNDHEPHGERRPAPAHGVPGGASRLPRLRPPTTTLRHRTEDAPSVELVESGFLDDPSCDDRRSRDELPTWRRHVDRTAERTVAGSGSFVTEEEPTYLSFADYSPTESLFTGTTGRAADGYGDAEAEDVDDPLTAALGVEADADWKTIQRAHRGLLVELHPDRFVTADDATRRSAEERLATINIAFAELEKRRHET